MSEFIAYPLEILNETYLQLSHAHVSASVFLQYNRNALLF